MSSTGGENVDLLTSPRGAKCKSLKTCAIIRIKEQIKKRLFKFSEERCFVMLFHIPVNNKHVSHSVFHLQ